MVKNCNSVYLLVHLIKIVDIHIFRAMGYETTNIVVDIINIDLGIKVNVLTYSNKIFNFVVKLILGVMKEVNVELMIEGNVILKMEL